MDEYYKKATMKQEIHMHVFIKKQNRTKRKQNQLAKNKKKHKESCVSWP